MPAFRNKFKGHYGSMRNLDLLPPPGSSRWADTQVTTTPTKCTPGTHEVFVSALESERERTRVWMGEWMEHSRKLYEEHAAQQERLMQKFLEVQGRTLTDLKLNLGAHARDPTHPEGARTDHNAGNWAGGDREHERVLAADRGPSPRRPSFKSLRPLQSTGGGTDDDEPSTGMEGEEPEEEDEEEEGVLEMGGELDKDFHQVARCENLMTMWRRTSGLHTVFKWVCNYHKHPAGWGALLMIHGIPEVTGRLRQKVENYAIYSALFLSMSIPLLADKPQFIQTTCSEDMDRLHWFGCHLRIRLWFYGLAFGITAHLSSILLAMAFLNALNEAARDSDVYRMFARGKGFLATVKCQMSFRIGCAAVLVAVAASVSHHLGWESAIVGFFLALMTAVQLRRCGGLLFRTASIVRYWRVEKGGKPDPDDPYDLDVPLSIFKECTASNEKYFKMGRRCTFTQTSSHASLNMRSNAQAAAGGNSLMEQQAAASAVAAIF